jgi:hypothetical protein
MILPRFDNSARLILLKLKHSSLARPESFLHGFGKWNGKGSQFYRRKSFRLLQVADLQHRSSKPGDAGGAGSLVLALGYLVLNFEGRRYFEMIEPADRMSRLRRFMLRQPIKACR